MFRLDPLQDVFPLDRHQILDELFTSVEHHGKISKVWLNRCHLHIATGTVAKNDGKLFTLDATVTQDGSPSIQRKKPKYFDISSSSVIIDVCFSKISPSLTYVVHSHGHIECWATSSLQDSDWSEVAKFSILIDEEFNQVCSAVLCNDVIIWCQASVTQERYYAICQKPLTGTEKRTTSQTTLLNHCPYTELICIGDTVILWPRYTCNGQLFLMWTPVTNTLLIVTTSKGLIEKRTIDRNEDFHSVILQNMGTVSKATMSRVIGQVKYKEDLLLISDDGNVMSLNKHGVIKQKFKFSKVDEVDIEQVCHWFVYRFTLAAVTSHKMIRFYSLDTGSLLYDLSILEYGDVLCPLPRHDSTDMIILWNQTSLMCLQVCETDRLQEYIPASDTVQLLCHHGNYNQATQMVVDSCCKNDDTVHLHGSLLDIFKSPTVFLSLLHKVENSKNLTENIRITKDLDQSLERYQSGKETLIENKLTDDLAKLLEEFLTLTQTQQDVVLGQLQNGGTCHDDFKIKAQVLHLLQNLKQTGNLESCKKLEILANHFPQQVTETMMLLLIDSDHSIDEKIWSFVLATDTALKCMPVFEIFCRLLFTEQPQKLLEFVKLASQKKDNAAGVTAFTRKREKFEFYERALQCLPCVEDSKNWTEAVRAQVQLILHCSEDMYNLRKALLLLLQYELWQDGIELVHQHASQSQQHNELFHLLLVKTLKEASVMNALYEDIWNILPKNMSVTNLLQVLQENVNQQEYMISAGNRVQCDRKEDVQLVVIQSQLLKMLQSQ